MNWRYKLADWISGGELTKATFSLRQSVDNFIALHGTYSSYRTMWKDTRDALDRLAVDNRNGWSNSTRFKTALSDIAAMETPGAAPAARRMANRAREALK